MQLFDSHLHLNHPDFEGRVDEVWQAAQEAHVAQAVVIGYDLASSQAAIRIAENHDSLWATVGVSPHEIAQAPEDYIEQLEALAGHPKVCAIGEAGLEYHYPVGPAQMQIREFNRQTQLANRLGKAIVIHLRDADEDFLRVLDECPPDRAIMHCFTASMPVMQAAVDRGYMVSFSGIVTFKKAQDIQQAAEAVPQDNLLIETDSPYLAPVPFRGKPCEPKMIVHTAEKVAQLRNTPLEDIAAVTRANAHRIFQLDHD